MVVEALRAQALILAYPSAVEMEAQSRKCRGAHVNELMMVKLD